MPIIKAAVADTAELTQLVNSAYRGESSKAGWTTESHLLDGQRIDDEMMLAYLQDENAKILKYTNEGGVIIGCVYVEKKGDQLYLGMLTVSPTLQGGGIGRKLIAAAEAEARKQGCNAVTMTVISTRAELIAWYERNGYKATGEVRPFHTEERFGIRRSNDPMEMIVMEKQIS
ncbi:GNAT family N-acetyltransferase [Mucilaginibacter sp. RS28]|uniref:GNAT family N-acetyltransferase n=1 Tax=Mucilaginibacter straminoryzae TaxID=2932774 RepID=A0A9X1X0T4_9SPHI|nr:GNAT family N-acetyltransferase [Mucilaginibacter straminoryzae]MCJ8208691.1 GNAT family N-acetyltransferase [Mucilaginibacter straminoryzae]